MKFELTCELKDELRQIKDLEVKVLERIIFSKRLLVEHVHALENCLKLSPHRFMVLLPSELRENPSDAPPLVSREIFTGRRTCALIGVTFLEHLITPKKLRFSLIPSLVLSSGFGILYVVKKLFASRNKIIEDDLKQLICSFEDFSTSMRQNMSYFNEANLMTKNGLHLFQMEHAWDTISAAKEVTELLFDATRYLEETFLMPKKLEKFYSPMEELNNCEHFNKNTTQYGANNLKDFYNIYQYIQSQFLLRFAIAILSDVSIVELKKHLVKIDCVMRHIVHQEISRFSNLVYKLDQINYENQSLHMSKTMQNRCGPVAALHESSLQLRSCFVAVANECQTVESELRKLNFNAPHSFDSENLNQITNAMSSIESALSLCCTDFQRFMLNYNKFLSKIDSPESETKDKKYIDSCATSDDDMQESFLRVEISENSNNEDPKDDFFAYIFDENEAKEEELNKTNKSSIETDILHLENRITKGKFRPVLQQLKARINPIRKDLLEKERKILASKGVNIDELDVETVNDDETSSETKGSFIASDSYTDSDSDESFNEEFQRHVKMEKKVDRFAEMRKLLSEKNQISFFSGRSSDVPKATGKEEILESDC